MFVTVNGQFIEPKFGNVEMSDLTMTKYDKDTTAGALILFDNGTTDFKINYEMNFQFVFRRHYQIKILKKSGFNLGDVSIRVLKGNFHKEDVTGLKAFTYNLIDGKIVKTKLDNDNVYKSEAKNYYDIKFAFPGLKEGSIIELAYTLTSDFLYNFKGWTFQYYYPARWSQYSYEIPEYFDYREASKGYLHFEVLKKAKGLVTFNLPVMNVRSENRVEQHTAAESHVIKANSSKVVLATSDVPAFISEPDIDCEDNYLQSIEFELSSIEFPGSIRKDYTQSWESVNTQMKEDEDFGNLLRNDSFVKDTVKLLTVNKDTDIAKAISIYNYVQNRMKWNGESRLWSTNGLKKPFTESVGNSSEINLILALMLRTAGLEANPVMFSTRENGIANTHYPTITKFNSILTTVTIGDKVILLDATSKFCPFGVLPPNDVNGQGRIVNNTGGDWVNLDVAEKYKEKKVYDLEISPEGTMKGSITGIYNGYAGIAYRNSLNTEKSESEYFRKVQENMRGLTINKYIINDRYNNYLALRDSLNVEVNDQIDIVGDRILFKPMLYEMTEKNRYTLEDRKYPVNYNYPINEICIFNYTLPKGYVAESLPKSALYRMSDNSIYITYKTSVVDNKLTIEYSRNVNKILFLPEDYGKLKELYDLLVKKNAEQVILKKTI